MAEPLVDRLKRVLAGRYTIERELGRGGMALVFVAHDHRHDRTVALKLLQPEITSAITAERFLREIKITARLQHPNILGLFDSGAEDGFCYYVMPLVEGVTLRDRLEREQLSLDEAFRIATDVGSALAYAHSRSVIHRDIKPENILFSAGRAMLTDFGLARAVSEGQRSITVAGMSLGTPPYMSPEQALGLETIDHRSDIYALGCVLFEMVAGRPPFVGNSATQMIQQHVQVPPPPVRNFRPDAPPALDAVLQRALAKAPDDRYQSADEMLAALQQVQAPSAAAAPAPAAAPTATAGAGNPRLPMLIGIAVIVVAVIAVILLALV
ncbi:MAG TPA: serine/threonine-protein kinase [Gemmatimonadales bacterium]|nr:serine/threonine-protein kinase [Gemmatimonadales bacterium]